MENRVKGYVDNLFSGIYETKELSELKEEIGSNLLAKIEDFISSGSSEDDAFNKAISDLGDMSELIEGLKKASEQKVYEDMYKKQPIDRKHVIGYITSSIILLLGIMLSGKKYLDAQNFLGAMRTLTPFLIISTGLYVYLGLTQETKQHYGMKEKRAAGYSLATMTLLVGLILAGLSYFSGTELSRILTTSMLFIIPSAIVYMYLGLTETNRSKVDWQKQWIEHYSNPKTMMIYGNIIGALWIFALGAIPLVGLKLGWEYAWVPFVVAIGIQLIADAIFASKRK